MFQSIRESVLRWSWHSKQIEKQKELLLKLAPFFRGISLTKSIENTQYCLMKGGKKEKTKTKHPDETSIAILPNINTIFYPGGWRGRSWQNMKRKIVWITMKFSYENIFVILLSGLLLLNQHFINISILLGGKSHYMNQYLLRYWGGPIKTFVFLFSWIFI